MSLLADLAAPIDIQDSAVEASLHATDAKEHHGHAEQSAPEGILHCEIA